MERETYTTTSRALTASDIVGYNSAERIRVNPTEKGRVENWFIEPLKKLGGDDSIVCLMICFPILEKILRADLSIADDMSLTLSDGSPALKLLAKLLSIPEADARLFWDCFRNGLMHRAMVKGDIEYILDPSEAEKRPAMVVDGVVTVFVWSLRDKVVEILTAQGKHLWKDDASHPLPKVY